MCQLSEKEEQSAEDPGEKGSSCHKVDKAEKVQRKMLSRDSSQDYTDSTGIDLHEFLVNTLKNNPRDRITLLKLEQDILDFISNNESQKRKFPPMTSYHRMLLHRVAAYFGMDHNVDPSGKSVVINKTANTRIPDQKFSEHIKDDRADDFQKRYILKRDNSSFDRDDGTIRMRLKADKKSKSMEEREEEYQRARDRIFAHDGEHFILDRRSQDKETCMSTQQRRQIFRLRAGRSGTSRQSSSETEAAPRYGEPRPWSSTDSSDSSHRLAPRPAITKASSFSGICPGLVRGDSTASSRSTGRLSKTGSESSSSVASSSSSLSRPPLPPVPAPAPSQANGVPAAPAPRPAPDARDPGVAEEVKSGPPPAPAPANFYVLPLEAAGIPAGSVLVNPHTGQPLVNPDGSTVVYDPSNPASTSGRNPMQGKPLQQPIPATALQQPANHLHSQPIYPSIQLSSEPVQYSAVSYPPLPRPLPPSQFLPVCPNQQYTLPDTLNAQFSHMTLERQPPGDGGARMPDAHHCPAVYHHHHHHHPSSLMLQGAPPQQVAGYVMAGPSGGLHGIQPVPTQVPAPGTAPTYPNSSPGPGGFQGSAMSHPFLQQHAYIQQPVQQVAPCYCAPTHYPHCASQQQPYRPSVTPLPYMYSQGQNLPQQQAYQTMMPSPAPSYQTIVGVQPTPNPALTGSQQSNMGNQMQGMMVQYTPIPSYQVSVPHGSQSVPQQTYQQPVVVSCQPGQGAVAMASMQPCYSLLSPNQHTTMSSTVSFLPAPVVEHLQFPQASSPCISQQHPGQQCAGFLPPASAGGMVMMQLTMPASQQRRAHSPCQRKQPGNNRYPSLEHQRCRRPMEILAPLDNSQSSVQLGSHGVSPAPSPSPGPLGALKGLPIMAHHHQLPTAFCPNGQGEAHYSLLGQPVQYKASIGPPLLHTAHQGPLGVWRGVHGRKASRKALATDLSVGEPVSSRILEVTDLPEGISCSEAHCLLGELCQGGAMIKWLSEHHPRLCGPAGDAPDGDLHAGSFKPPRDLASSYTILAMFPSNYAAQNALLRHSSPLTTFKLRTSNGHKEKPCDPDGTSKER
ncbi:R3H domain-containing protein 1-like [Polymixia lowei]